MVFCVTVLYLGYKTIVLVLVYWCLVYEIYLHYVIQQESGINPLSAHEILAQLILLFFRAARRCHSSWYSRFTPSGSSSMIRCASSRAI